MKNISAISLLALITSLIVSCSPQEKETSGSASMIDAEKKDRNVAGLGLPRGVITNIDDDEPGYILINPSNSSSTYLLNRQGEVLHEWKGEYHSWLTYLRDNGHVIRAVVDPDAPRFHAGGMAGRIEELDWLGETIWEFEYATDEYQTHHDLEVLPNGNVLAIAWEHMSYEEAIQEGRNPHYLTEDGLWMDKVIEVKPIKPRGGKIVWEWRFSDHLIQNHDPALSNYGEPAAHPELLDINASAHEPELLHPDTLRAQKKKGLAHRNATVGSESSDIYHSNAINYNEELDQIAISVPHINEIFIIDHSTTTEEARGHTGGRWGKGGDFLYRWGNPLNYGRGDSTDQKLFYQHDVRWIEEGKPGEGHLTLYNNQVPNGPDSMKYSAVFEMALSVDENGHYTMSEDSTFGPEGPIWSYVAADTVSLFSPFTSGAHRMENGNTFILCGAPGRSLEVTPDGEIVWDFWNPYQGDIRQTNGDRINDGPFLYWQFRSTFIPADHPALQGKELKPLDPQPKVLKEKQGA
ncbi:MAG: aryl-sulfate sulfotransferase [Cyclobacteriaceae bacterium]|nr:aryl-sulfate sulfotransferase [Cyclobacteriaceae bacterium]